MSFKERVKASPLIKRTAVWMMNAKGDPRPRPWMRYLLNPFIHKKGKGARIRGSVRLDIFPYNKFHLGAGSIIEDFATVNNGVGDLYIGRETIIGIGSVLIGPVSIGDHVMLAQHIVVSGLNHGYEDISLPPSKQPVSCKEIVIGDNVWIGANAVITAGVQIGKHAIIGAGSVVTRSVPAYAVAAGNPARVLKIFNKETNTWERVLPS
ncbi:acyltransferase [Niabella terrae]